MRTAKPSLDVNLTQRRKNPTWNFRLSLLQRWKQGWGIFVRVEEGRVLCNEWKKHWRVYKQSQCIEATASEIFRWGLGGTQNHKLNHLSSFQQRRRLSTLCLVLCVCVCVCVCVSCSFMFWRLMSKWKHWAIPGLFFPNLSIENPLLRWLDFARATDEFYSEPLRVVTSENSLSF